MSFTPEQVDQFIYFATTGIVMNFTMLVVAFILTFIKTLMLRKDELFEVIKFFQTRKSMINGQNDQLTLFVNYMFIFLPFYIAWIYTVYIWYLIMRRGVWGIISASVKADSFSIIQLVKYEFVSLKDK